jgi:hypothetical protein
MIGSKGMKLREVEVWAKEINICVPQNEAGVPDSAKKQDQAYVSCKRVCTSWRADWQGTDITPENHNGSSASRVWMCCWSAAKLGHNAHRERSATAGPGSLSQPLASSSNTMCSGKKWGVECVHLTPHLVATSAHSSVNCRGVLSTTHGLCTLAPATC